MLVWTTHGLEASSRDSELGAECPRGDVEEVEPLRCRQQGKVVVGRTTVGVSRVRTGVISWRGWFSQSWLVKKQAYFVLGVFGLWSFLSPLCNCVML